MLREGPSPLANCYFLIESSIFRNLDARSYKLGSAIGATQEKLAEAGQTGTVLVADTQQEYKQIGTDPVISRLGPETDFTMYPFILFSAERPDGLSSLLEERDFRQSQSGILKELP